MEEVRIIDTTMDNVRDFGVCGYRNEKRAGYPEKLGWLEKRFREGLKLKTLVLDEGGNQGMIEYIPGEYCWRPVEAEGYLFIHCLFVGFKREYKGKGYASLLIEDCLEDAKKLGKHGVAVVTRKGSFMVRKKIFLKHGFQMVDRAAPDFELLVLKFDDGAPDPRFKDGLEGRAAGYGKGLTIIRAQQCPYTVKNVKEIVDFAEKEYGITAKVIDLKSHQEAQDSPCAFGSFCMIYDGKLVAHHPISKGRFKGIIRKVMG